jgi:hypothetical protein
MPGLDDSRRPDRSGVLLIVEPAVAGYPAPFGISLVLIGDPEVVRRDDFAGLVGGFVDRRTPVYLNLPGPPGNWAHRQLLNEDLSAAVAARELPRIKAILWGMYLYLKSLPPRPIDSEGSVPAMSRSS